MTRVDVLLLALVVVVLLVIGAATHEVTALVAA